MKPSLHPKDFFGLSCQGFLSVILAISCSCLFAATENKVKPTEEDIFQSTNLLRISIEIPEAGLQSLRNSRPGASLGTKPQAIASVTENGTIFTNVSVQLKGFSTFQPVDLLPSLTLNFGDSSRKQKFHGLSKISL